VSLEDIHSADTKGKWWLVGAAWAGDPLVERQAESAKSKELKASAESESNVLLSLARKQGMNTDIRRSVFVVLMSSDVGNPQ
jgi:nucleolar MIF4G domain-containing protein 1